MTRRVVITGMGGVTAFGEDWPTISRRLREYENAVRTMTIIYTANSASSTTPSRNPTTMPAYPSSLYP